MLIHGACHCRNISFALTWEPDPSEIPARACGCSFCTRHGGVWTSNPGGALRIQIAEPALGSRYTFGTGTAVFHICGRCGVVPVVTSDLDGHLHAVVSVNAFVDVPPSLLRPTPVSHDGESFETRLARRRRNWIADVQLSPSSRNID